MLDSPPTHRKEFLSLKLYLGPSKETLDSLINTLGLLMLCKSLIYRFPLNLICEYKELPEVSLKPKVPISKFIFPKPSRLMQGTPSNHSTQKKLKRKGTNLEVPKLLKTYQESQEQ